MAPRYGSAIWEWLGLREPTTGTPSLAEAAMYIVGAVILSMLAAAALVAFVARAAAEDTSEDRLNP